MIRPQIGQSHPVSCKLARDQRGRRMIVVSNGRHRAVLNSSDYIENSRSFWRKLNDSGIPVTTRIRREIHTLLDTEVDPVERALVADRSGWIEGMYVFGDSHVFSADPTTAAQVHVAFPKDPKFGTSGSLGTWRSQMGPLLAGQHLLVGLTCLAFVPVLLQPYAHLAGLEDNPCLNICGRGSSGKTTALMLMASVWGGQVDMSGGYVESWQMTPTAIGTLIQAHSDALLVLDEAGLLEMNSRKQNERVGNAVMWLASGRGRSRHEQAAAARVRLMAVSSSNLSVGLVGPGSEATNLPLQTRMPNLDISGRQFGILDVAHDRQPADIIAALQQAARLNYGTPIRMFIQRLVRERAKTPEGLEGSIRSGIETFQTKALFHRLSPEERRVGASYALAFVAARLARQWNILPEEWWTYYGTSLLKTFALARQGLRNGGQAEPIGRFEAAVHQMESSLDGVQDRDVSQPAEGFLRVDRSGSPELLFEPKKFSQWFGHIPGLLRALRDAGALIVENGQTTRLTTKRPLRAGGQQVRVHCIRLDPSLYPDEIRVRRQA